MNELHLNQLPIWIKTIDKLKLGPLVSKFRTDTHRIPAGQRIDIIDALGLFSNQRTLRRKKYDINNILRQSLFSIEDLTFNCIFIRANQHLRNIAKSLRVKLPEGLEENMLQSENALEKLWDPYTGQYYSRDFVSHRLLKEQSVATLMPLYTGVIPKERAEQLVRLIENQHLFGAPYPVPSVPLSSEWFDPSKYWQGPTWINTNWLVVDGLRRMGFEDHATALKLSTIDLVIENGIYEYYNPQTGESGGAKDFSWTASLVVDLIHS
jgi:glycogen debranching enzyme